MTFRSTMDFAWRPVLLTGLLVGLHALFSPVAEPFKNGDETRHVMTGVFFHDAIIDWRASTSDPRGFAVTYYLQYPSLGLIVWPPVFHIVEGLAMSIFGTSYLVACLVVYGFAIAGGVFAYRLFRLTDDSSTALTALGVLGLCPLVFMYSSYVLLEIPTLTFVVASIFYFERYIKKEQPRDAVLACVMAALAALTRFDGVVLLPFVFIRLGMTRKWTLLLRRPVWIGVLLALVMTVPYYLFTWSIYGSGIEHAATSGTGNRATSLLDLQNFYLYPSFLPRQLGWAASFFAVIGLVACLRQRREGEGVYIALIAATYLTFVPLAEPEERHAIYWIPAFSMLAVRGMSLLARNDERRKRIARVALLVAVGLETLVSLQPSEWRGLYIRGTDEAAQKVLAKTSGERPLLYDGQLNGAFIYAVRCRDPQRRFVVLRADKVLYSVFSDPMGGYDEYAKNDEMTIDLLHRYDPEFIVIEEPQVIHTTAAGDRLRRILRQYPAEYALEHTIPLSTNYGNFRPVELLVYRKLTPNPNRVPMTVIPVKMIGTTLVK